MLLPYQCLVSRVRPKSELSEWTVFGASGSKLLIQSSTGAKSSWVEQETQIRDENQDDDSPEPPGKRIRLEGPQEQHANFSNLTLSNDGCYLVAITGEDKCIRVLEVDSQGQLQQLSKRCMSRRPCSIALTSDDATILCADKFGDVYALPLLPSVEAQQLESPPVEEPAQHNFKPAASTLTVHSGRNRKTLEEQLKQKAKEMPKTKDPLKFKHDLLLGHVSMLTDIVYAKSDSRSYIITADRDEHIRISRGQPQAHIIEGFCFGHECFVSKLCLTRSGLLVSGGGDDHLFVWSWQNYRLVKKLPIRDTVLSYLKSHPALSSAVPADTDFQVAVSGIWDVPGNDNESNEVLVACEGISALFSFKLEEKATSGDTIALLGNALDLAFLGTTTANTAIVVSIDNFQKPNSTTKIRDNENTPRLQYFSKATDSQWTEDETVKADLSWFEGQGLEDSFGGPNGENTDAQTSKGKKPGQIPHKTVQDMLYNIENLRKRPGTED